MRPILFAILSFLFCASIAQANCRLGLILALDVSGSVNEREYRQQLDGLAFALQSPEVVELFLNDDNHVSLLAYEWSATNHQRLIFDWTDVKDTQTVQSLSKIVVDHRKNRATLKTAIGKSLDFAADQFLRKPDCWAQTIDISGDGLNNDGRDPIETRLLPKFRDITVNALVVSQPDETGENAETRVFRDDKLYRYFEAQVIHGPDSFVEIAYGYEQYASAMKRKLIRELSPKLIGFGPKKIISAAHAGGL